MSDPADSPTAQAWADAFGVWHVRVRRTVASPLLTARRALRDELSQRERNLARRVWMHPVRVPEVDDASTIVYREN